LEVFFYIPKEKETDVLECGLRLKDWASRTINIDGVKKRYIPMLINPKDNLSKYNNADFVPLKIKVIPSEIFVSDGSVYREEDVDNPDNLYRRSLIFLDKYIFGSYRMPECLYPSSVSNELISKLDRHKDVPVLYDSSEELYLQHEFERGKETYDNFIDKVLYTYYEHLHSLGLCIRHYKTDDDIIVYESLVEGRIITVKRR
jgi:hypothetical protein